MGEAVTRFRDLLRHIPGEDWARRNARTDRELVAAVAESALHWWQVGQPIPAGERVLLIGVAVWSGYDLNTLDQAEAAVRAGHGAGTEVHVFDAHELQSDEQLAGLLPGVHLLYQSPYVGLCCDGQVVEAAGGYLGRQLVARALGIDDAPMHQRITASVSDS
jgi:hypothetical protein